MYNQYYNPYMANNTTSLFSRIKSFNWGGFLNNTQKTLSVINQAIPIVNQVRPIVNNAKTMFRVMKEVNTPDINTNNSIDNNTLNNQVVSNKPQFFIEKGSL